MEKSLISEHSYQLTEFAHSACNLSGLVHDLSRILTNEIWPEARRLGHGTDWVNQHPIVICFVNQIMYLSGADDFSNVFKAIKFCEDKAKQTTFHKEMEIPVGKDVQE